MFSWFKNKVSKIANIPLQNEPKSIKEIKIEPNPMLISLDEYLTSSGKYKDRLKSPECTEEVKENAKKLLEKVNPFLIELGIAKVTVSSGFRTSGANAALANSAKKSLHMQGKACDLADLDESLDKLIASRPDLLKKYGLWLESPDHTPNWCHLDDSTVRTDRPSRIFNP